MIKIQLTKETEDFLKQGTAVHDDYSYYHLPFWFKSTEQEGVYEILMPEEVPKRISDFFKGFPHETPLIDISVFASKMNNEEENPIIALCMYSKRGNEGNGIIDQIIKEK